MLEAVAAEAPPPTTNPSLSTTFDSDWGARWLTLSPPATATSSLRSGWLVIWGGVKQFF